MLLWAPAAVFAQSTAPAVSLSGAGYELPSKNTMLAAPGQVVMVSVRGLKTVLPGPVNPLLGPSGPPTELSGVGVDFVQGSLTGKLGLRSVQQNPPCSSAPSAPPCNSDISILTQIPFELDTASRAPALLRIRENGAVAGEVRLNPVTDNVHVINTCDDTLIFLSAAASARIPAGACVPMVMNTRGLLVHAGAPAQDGDILSIYAFGLGAVDRQPSPQEISRAVEAFSLNFQFSGGATAADRRISGVAPLSVSMVGGGTYQINFVMPPVPAGIPACEGPDGANLTILVTGPQSSSPARICTRKASNLP